VASLGAQLKQEREKQGMTLEQISLATKIGTRMLRALEEEHFDQLPGGIFNKGFIRAYARCLHMDEDQAIADYVAATTVSPAANQSESDDQTTVPPPILDPPSRDAIHGAGLPWGIFAVVLLIVALGFAAWGYYSRESQKAAPESTIAPANSVSSAPATVTERSSPEQNPITSKPATATTAAAVPTRSQTSTASRPQSSAPANETFVVLVKAREDSWLSISVDGEVVTRSLLTAPAQKSVRGEKEITIRAGNVGAVDFEFNGKKLPTQGDYGEVKTLTFDAHGLQSSASKAAPPAQIP
jgi:cytoskeleton protein RodZ